MDDSCIDVDLVDLGAFVLKLTRLSHTARELAEDLSGISVDTGRVDSDRAAREAPGWEGTLLEDLAGEMSSDATTVKDVLVLLVSQDLDNEASLCEIPVESSWRT